MSSLKLEELRAIVSAAPHSYPTAYHLAIVDGVYDVPTIERAMTSDIFNFVAHETRPLNPYNHPLKRKVSIEDLSLEEERLADLDDIAETLAADAVTRHDLKAANQCIHFIQSHGRNSQAARTLVESLKPKPSKPVRITRLIYETNTDPTQTHRQLTESKEWTAPRQTTIST